MRTAARVLDVREDCDLDLSGLGELALTASVLLPAPGPTEPAPMDHAAEEPAPPDIVFLDDGELEAPAVPRRRRFRVRWRYVAVGLLVMLLSGAVAGIVKQREENRDVLCRSNIERIGQALLDYQRDHGALPPSVIAGQGGQPLLSWRVAILPYLGRQDLYDQFRFDEPWDGPHNAALLAKMPEVFACPSDGRCLKYCRTPYLVIVGPEANEQMGKPLFERARGVDQREILDGTAFTVMVAEASRLVPWTKPDDLSYEPDGPLPQFGKRHGDRFNVVYADGRADAWRGGRSAELLRGAITRDGNEILGA